MAEVNESVTDRRVKRGERESAMGCEGRTDEAQDDHLYPLHDREPILKHPHGNDINVEDDNLMMLFDFKDREDHNTELLYR